MAYHSGPVAAPNVTAGILSVVPLDAVAPADSFLDAEQVILEIGGGQMGTLLSRISDWLYRCCFASRCPHSARTFFA